jgi:hypothetical protein
MTLAVNKNENLNNFLKEKVKMTTKEFVEKYSKIIIKKGSKVIKKTKDFEIVGVRNSRDKFLSLYILIDMNATSQSCNYGRIDIAKGNF